MMETPVRPGDVLLGKYLVERVLGCGGMGVVLAARHIDLGQLFAIKLMLPAALADKSAVGRFLREARAAARLRDEHVARVHDVGRLQDGAPYMVLEHLSGQDLKQVLRARGPLPPEEAATYVYQACEAIAEAHSIGIVHRDLKPANLFLTQRPNGTPCVKVLDFGISKELEPTGEGVSDLTKTGMFMGSPHYMSPEQMIRSKEADPRSDIWALGVILFELLTGKRPFTANSVMELIVLVASMPPTCLGDLRKDLPPTLEALVLKCLEKPRELRFQTVPELMAALQPFVSRDSVILPAVSSAQTDPGGQTELGMQTTNAWTGTSARQRGRRKMRIAGSAAAGMVLLMIGGVWLASGRRADNNSSVAAESDAPIVTPAVTEAISVTTAATASSLPKEEQPRPTVTSSGSPLVSAKPASSETKAKTRRPGSASTAPRQSTSAAPESSSTIKVRGFYE